MRQHTTHLAILASLLIFAGCSHNDTLASKQATDPGPAPVTGDATEFLKWSMAKHQALGSFSADASVTMTSEADPSLAESTQKRSIQYRSPNLYKVVSERPELTQTSVSDGKMLTEYSNMPQIPTMEYPAPSTIADVTSMLMTHPMFCGSLLYAFFGGPASLESLVNTAKGPVEFDETIKVSNAKVVKFYATGHYGNTRITIDETTGMVQRIEYDSDPLIKLMQSGTLTELLDNDAVKKGAKDAGIDDLGSIMGEIANYMTVEKYTEIKANPKLDAETFSAKPPKDAPVQQMYSPSSRKSTVPIGAPAPNATLTGLDGKTIQLSSLKGTVVLIDFWATWCGPCRIGLPKTQKLHDEFGGKGLQVLVVSDEDRETVNSFLKENKYTFPAYLDEGGKANAAFGITAIPTIAILDKQGRMASFFVGLADDDAVRTALKKAGLDSAR